jgi:hypothetical protein
MSKTIPLLFLSHHNDLICWSAAVCHGSLCQRPCRDQEKTQPIFSKFLTTWWFLYGWKRLLWFFEIKWKILGTSSLHQNYFTINDFEFSRCCLRSCILLERLIGCSLDDDPISLVVTGCTNVGLISLVMVESLEWLECEFVDVRGKKVLLAN